MPSYCCSSSEFLQSHYTVLPSSFLLPFSCTSWCCCSLPFISQILQVRIFSFSVLSIVTQIKKTNKQTNKQKTNLCSDPGLFLLTVTAALKVVIIESRSASLLFTMARGANFPPVTAWKVSNTLGSFSFSMSNLSLVCFGLLILFSCEDGRSSSASHNHFQCLLLENFVFWRC